MKNNPKFSILIPTRNGGKYLPYCLESILSQDYDDVEIIISNNRSEDETNSYLNTITDKRVKTIQPTEVLSMADNYEFVLAQATGDWIMILGDDDAVQSYFFELVEFLTKKAEEKKINLINSFRSYFFWDGCEFLHSDNMLNYHARAFYTIESTKYQVLTLLSGQKPYFETPQMYTTSLFNRKIIERVKYLQDGRFYTTITPDANAAAIACSVENKYIDCKIPIAWVGTSPKSYGVMGEAWHGRKDSAEAEMQKRIREMAHLALVKDSHSWHPLSGNIKICSAVLYYWESLLHCEKLQSAIFKKIITSSPVKTLAFSSILRELQDDTKTQEQRLEWLKEICDINDIAFKHVEFVQKRILPYLVFIFNKLDYKKNRKYRKADGIYYEIKRNDENKDMTIIDACSIVKELENEKQLVTQLIGDKK